MNEITGGLASPFPLHTPPERAFVHEGWARARTALLEAVDQGGLSVLAGEAGSGKTLLLRELERMLRASGREVAYAERGDLAPPAAPGLVRLLDEAGALDEEGLRRLAGEDGATVLAGLPSLLGRIEALGLRAARVTLPPLSLPETRVFVTATLAAAGATPGLLSPGAVAALAVRSQGLPRLVTTLGRAALFHAQLEGSETVEARHIEAADAMRPGSDWAEEPGPAPRGRRVVVSPLPEGEPPEDAAFPAVAPVAAAVAAPEPHAPEPPAPALRPAIVEPAPPEPGVAAPAGERWPRAEERRTPLWRWALIALLSLPLFALAGWLAGEALRHVEADPRPAPRGEAARPIPVEPAAPAPEPAPEAAEADTVPPPPPPAPPAPPRQAAAEVPRAAPPEPPRPTPSLDGTARFRGASYNETIGRSGGLSLSIVPAGPGGAVVVRFDSYGGLVGSGELQGRVWPDGRLVASGTLLMGRNPFVTEIEGQIEGDRLVGSATYIRVVDPGQRSSATRGRFTLQRE